MRPVTRGQNAARSCIAVALRLRIDDQLASRRESYYRCARKRSTTICSERTLLPDSDNYPLHDVMA